ncbi:MAG: hypothetical protein ACI4V7_11165 [Succinivibrionaceae bacterium]
MIKIDFRFDQNYIKQLVGKYFLKYRCDELIFTNSVAQFVELYISDKVFSLENLQELTDYFGYNTDVAILKFIEKKEQCVYEKQVDNFVHKKIKQVKIVNENQKMYIRNKIEYDIFFTRAIIFILDDLEEICFEKDTLFFSEEIIVNRGHNLINVLGKSEQFMETMKEEKDAKGEYFREEIILS